LNKQKQSNEYRSQILFSTSAHIYRIYTEYTTLKGATK